MMRALICLGLVLGAVLPLGAQSPPEITKLTVRPAAPPPLALKYEFLPELMDRSPGNAALLYQRAHSPEWWGSGAKQKYLEKVDRWLELPLSELPLEEVRFLETWGPLREVDRAARREYCDWEMTERVKAEGINLLLPDVQGFRSYAALLGARCRLEMAEGKLDKAIYTLQTGYGLARDIANAPTLIQALVGLATGQIMTNQVEQLIQRPDAPNVYWALATLPEPFIDLRKPLQGERLFLESTYPEIKTIETTVWDAHQQQQFLSRLEHMSDVVRGAGFHTPSPLTVKVASVGMVIKVYPEARRFLLASGRPAAEVDAMPAMQVALIYWLHAYRRFQDDYHKWVALPYWQAGPGLHQTDQELRAAASRFERFPFLEFLPAIDRIYDARVRLDRRLAALRCIEAVRLYAAGHDGKLPAALRDIKEVPIPVDPATGRDFDYAVAGDRVTLREPGLAAGRPLFPASPLNYEVTFKR